MTPDYVKKANAIQGYIGQETTLIQAILDGPDCNAILPVLRSGTEMPAYLHAKHYVDMRYDSQYSGQFTELLYAMDALGTGIALRDSVFDEQNPLPGKLFAIELLRSPVWVRRRSGRTFVSISRAGVELAVYTVSGRQRIVDLTFTGHAGAREVQELDKEIHRVLLGKQNPMAFRLDQPNLRWASEAFCRGCNTSGARGSPSSSGTSPRTAGSSV